MKKDEILVGISAKVGGLMHHPLLYGRDYEFDKNKDLKRVEPASILLLSEVLASGTVPPDSADLDYNEIENPGDIAGRITNVFDAIDAGKELARIAKNSNSTTKPGASSPSAPAEGGE